MPQDTIPVIKFYMCDVNFCKHITFLVDSDLVTMLIVICNSNFIK